MNPFAIAAIGLFIFLILMFSHVPMAFALAIVGFGGICLVCGFGAGLGTLGSLPFTWSTMEGILPVPLFVLMGYFTFHSGISRGLFDASYKWVGKYPGGVAVATDIACTAFGACCGEATGAIATFGTIAYPEMERFNYDRGLSTSIIVAGAGLSAIIPPSMVYILFGILTSTSIGKLFIAGIFPGILIGSMYATVILWRCKRKPVLGPTGASFSWKERFKSLRGVIGALLLFVMIMGGLLAGVITPTEAGAMGAFGAFVIALIYRSLTFANLIQSARDTVTTTVFVLAILLGAGIFNAFISIIGLQSALASLVENLNVPGWVILAAFLFIYVPLGMVMDIVAVLLITAPIIVPILSSLGYDPILVCILVTLLMNTGGMSPPVAMGVFIVHQVTKVPISQIFRGIWPFICVNLIGVIIIGFFPQIALYLPNIIRY